MYNIIVERYSPGMYTYFVSVGQRHNFGLTKRRHVPRVSSRWRSILPMAVEKMIRTKNNAKKAFL